MRTIKKQAKVKTYSNLVYDRSTKEELTIPSCEIDGVVDFLVLSPDMTVLDKTLISEEEKIFSMSPETFFKYAYQDTTE